MSLPFHIDEIHHLVNKNSDDDVFSSDLKLENEKLKSENSEKQRELVRMKSILARKSDSENDNEQNNLTSFLVNGFRARIKSTEKKVLKPIRGGKHTYSEIQNDSIDYWNLLKVGIVILNRTVFYKK